MAGPTLAGQAVLQYGTTDDASYGILEDVTVTEEAGDKKEIKNGAGDTVGLIYADLRQKVSATFTPLTGDTLTAVKPGSEITVDGNTIRVDNAELASKKGDIQSWKVDGYVYPNLVTS
jgi:hypothetical protein